MPNLSDLFPSSGGGSLPGGMTKDPRLLPCYDATGVLELRQANTGAQCTVASLQFWDSIGWHGAFAASSTDDTYNTVCDITGSGFLFQVISQAITNVTDDVTFRITVDGTEYVIAKTQTWASAVSDNGRRVVLGACGSVANFYDAANGTWLRGFPSNASSASIQSFRSFGSGAAAHLLAPESIVTHGLGPYVRFDASLKVEVKVTDVYTVQTYGGRCGATYILD
ncbi:hypothetical protein [Agrobacterium sp. MS2]|uniref:hypothetical protein n=1 Tax=Agrobacterium sp. MS2 TaxID=1345498 RepID=UPI000DC0402F|nr:hypothetical protein [Agrobacterium sp. MS2]RAL95612.1 hypothetical protein DOU54_20865 [Agrobacterium sp. MS2]